MLSWKAQNLYVHLCSGTRSAKTTLIFFLPAIVQDFFDCDGESSAPCCEWLIEGRCLALSPFICFSWSSHEHIRTFLIESCEVLSNYPFKGSPIGVERK